MLNYTQRRSNDDEQKYIKFYTDYDDFDSGRIQLGVDFSNGFSKRFSTSIPLK